MADQRGVVSPPEKIGTLKKGEKIFFIPVIILYKNFFEKSKGRKNSVSESNQTYFTHAKNHGLAVYYQPLSY